MTFLNFCVFQRSKTHQKDETTTKHKKITKDKITTKKVGDSIFAEDLLKKEIIFKICFDRLLGMMGQLELPRSRLFCHNILETIRFYDDYKADFLITK